MKRLLISSHYPVTLNIASGFTDRTIMRSFYLLRPYQDIAAAHTL